MIFTSKLPDLTDDELRALLNDESLSLDRQLKVIDERRRRAAARRKIEQLAEMVATIPAMADLAESAEMVQQAQARLERAKWFRAWAVQEAVAAGYSLRTVAEVASVAPSTAMRLAAEQLPPELPTCP